MRAASGAAQCIFTFVRRQLRLHAAGMPDVTRLIDAAAVGDPHAASELLPLVYDELRRLGGAATGRREARPATVPIIP